MNRGYNLLAFPRGGYLIREKREGRTAERTMDPLRPLMSGRGGGGEGGKKWRVAMSQRK